MRIEAVILYDNLTDKEKAEYRHRIEKEESIPVYDGQDGQELIDAADILLTTNEIVSTKTKQFLYLWYRWLVQMEKL